MFKSVIILLIFAVVHSATTLTKISADNNNINAISNYSWQLTFDNFVNRTSMTFTFPNQVTTTLTTQALLSATPLSTINRTANTIIIDTTNLTIVASMNFTISNIQNPPSDITIANQFFFSSNIESMITIASSLDGVDYISGVLNSCLWNFDKCTEQINAELTVTFITTNPFLSGDNQIRIGYPTSWGPQYTESLMSNASPSSCLMTIDALSSNISTISCVSQSNRIHVNFNLLGSTLGSNIIVIKIQALNAPPTKNTAINPAYTISTYDKNGFIIDKLPIGSSCTIAPLCVTNFTNGIITPTSQPINSLITTLKTTFSSYARTSWINSDSV